MPTDMHMSTVDFFRRNIQQAYDSRGHFPGLLSYTKITLLTKADTCCIATIQHAGSIA